MVSDFLEPEAELAMLRRLAERSRRPLSVSLAQNERAPGSWRGILAAIERANADGVAMRAQVCGRPIGLVLGLPLTMNPFSTHPSHREIVPRSAEERLQEALDHQAPLPSAL